MGIRRVLACFLLAALATPAFACTKKVRWHDDGLYFHKNASGAVTGFSAELTRELLRRLGCEVEFVEMPWARGLAELEIGRIDIVPGTIIKPERRRYAYFSHITAQSQNALFMSNSAAAKYPIKRLQDLSGSNFRLGVQISVNYGDEFDLLAQQAQFRQIFKPVSARRNAWQMIQFDRLDGMIADLATGLKEIEQLGLSQSIRPSAILMKADPATYAFSKRSTTPEFVDQFDRAYAAMLADGSHQKLVEKFLRGATITTHKE